MEALLSNHAIDSCCFSRDNIVITNLQLVASSRFILLLWTQELLSVLMVFFDNNKQKLNAPVIARLVRQTV